MHSHMASRIHLKLHNKLFINYTLFLIFSMIILYVEKKNSEDFLPNMMIDWETHCKHAMKGFNEKPKKKKRKQKENINDSRKLSLPCTEWLNSCSGCAQANDIFLWMLLNDKKVFEKLQKNYGNKMMFDDVVIQCVTCVVLAHNVCVYVWVLCIEKWLAMCWIFFSVYFMRFFLFQMFSFVSHSILYFKSIFFFSNI